MTERRKNKTHPLLPPSEQDRFLAAISHLSKEWWELNNSAVAGLVTFAIDDAELESTVLRLFLWCRLHERPIPDKWITLSPSTLKSHVAGARPIDLKRFRENTFNKANEGEWSDPLIPYPRSDIVMDGDFWSFVSRWKVELGQRVRTLSEGWHDSIAKPVQEHCKPVGGVIESFSYLERRYKPESWSGCVKAFFDAGIEPSQLFSYCYQTTGSLPFPDSVASACQMYSADIHQSYPATDVFQWCDSVSELIDAMRRPDMSKLDALQAVLNAHALGVNPLRFVPEELWIDLAFQLLDRRFRTDDIRRGLKMCLSPMIEYVVTVPEKKKRSPAGPFSKPLKIGGAV